MTVFRRWKIALTAVAALLLALWGGVEWLLRSDWFEQKLLAEVRARLVQAVGGEVTVGSIEFDRSALQVTIRDLTARAAPGEEPFLNLPEMRVGLRIESFWRGEAALESIVLERPQIRIVSGPDGIANLPRRTGAWADPFQLGVRVVEVRGASIAWNDQVRNLSFSARDVDALAELDAGAGCVSLGASAGAASAQAEGRALAVDAGQTQARICGDKTEIEEAKLRVNGADVRAQGEVREYASPVADLELEASGPLAALAALIPEGVSPQGSFTFDGRVLWQTMAGQIEYDGQAAASGVRLSAFERDAEAGRLSARVAGNQDRLRLDGIEAGVFGGTFRGDAVLEQPLGAPRASLEGDVEGFRLRPLLESIAGQGGPDLRGAPWTASIRAHIKAETTAEGQLTTNLDIGLEGMGERPLSGDVHGRYRSSPARIELDDVRLRTDTARLEARGGWTAAGANVDLRWESENDVDLKPALLLVGVDLEDLPVDVLAEATLEGTLEGRIAPVAARDFLFDGKLDAGRIRLLNYEWTSLATDLTLTQDLLRIADARLRDGEGTADLTVEVELEPGVPLERKPLLGSVRARNLPAEKALAAGRLPALLTGRTDADAAISGNATDPDLRATATIRQGTLAGQPFDWLRLEVDSAGPKVNMSRLELTRGEGKLAGAGSYDRGAGVLDVSIEGSSWKVGELSRTFDNPWPLSGVANLDLRVQAKVRPGERPLEDLRADGEWSISSLAWAEHSFGDLSGAIATDGDRVTLGWNGSPLGGSLNGQAALRLDQDEVTGSAEFTGLDATEVFRLAGISLESVTGDLAGGFTFSGDPANIREIEIEGAIDKAELTVAELPGAGQGYALYNPFPMRWAIRRQALELEHMRLQGMGTDFEVDGDIALTENAPMDVAAEGVLNLAVLQSFRSDIEAEGSAVVNASVRGTVADPRVDGRLRIENGSVRSADFPNGLSALQGEVTFAGRDIRIEELSALSGGGRLLVSGTASLDDDAREYRFNVDVDSVRLRYPSNISSLIDGSIVLSGASNQGLLAGELVVRRASTNTQISLGALLAALREPTQTPARSPLLDQIQLNLHVVSGPEFELETALVRNMEADLDLRLVGTAVSPSVLGRMNINQGQVNFHGSRYTINRGEVSFVNPFRIEPVLDFELETRIRGIDIGLILSGPARRLNMSYRSDPPLSISDLVNLVAVGRSPTLDPVLASQQRVQQQSLFQTGANNVFESAIERPVSPGLQRFFGVSRLKVDPQAGGAEANPSARISTEQQITDEVTLIYTYDLSSAQQQTFRLEYAPDRRWTFVLTRDQNGLVGSDVLYKTRIP